MEKHQKVFFYTNLGLKGTPNGKSGFIFPLLNEKETQ